MEMASANKAELEALEALLYQFRVNELHILLSTFKCPKLGKKIELVQRSIALLQNARNQTAVMQKIREISWTRRHNQPSTPPYPDSGVMPPQYHTLQQQQHQQQQQQQSMISRGILKQPYSMDNMHTPYPIQMNRLSMLPISDLPFYDRQLVLLDLSELQANISGIRSSSRMYFSFSIPADLMPKLNYRDATPLPRFEVQLRFFSLDFSAEQEDDFPPNCMVKINDMNVTLPNVIPTNKPNLEPKRPSRPVDITSYCQHYGNVPRKNQMLVEWTADRRAWAVGIFLVHRVTAEILRRRLTMNVNARRQVDVTKQIIRDRLGKTDDDGIRMESLKISLLCPLGRKRIVIPVKSINCVHLQCFDLCNYLMMNEKRPTWKCGVCGNHASFKKLIIDGYFEKVLADVGENVSEIELIPDGSWRAVDNQNNSDMDDSDHASSSDAHKARNNGTSSSSKCTPSTSVQCDDVIVLDSDDEAETIVTSKKGSPTSVGQKGSSFSASNSSSYSKRSCDQSVICIDLDDSDASHSSITLSPSSIPNGVHSSSSSLTRGSVESPPQMPQPLLQPPHPLPYIYDNILPLPFAHGNTNFLNPYNPQMYQQDLNGQLITEELRNLMASIQRSTAPQNFHGY